MPIRKPLFALLIAGALLAAPLVLGTVRADDAMLGSAEAGHELALNVCSECHWAAEDQFLIPESEAPSFFEIAENPARTATSIKVFLQTPHRTMPNLILTPEETDDIVAYIMELREQR